ncbi:MAG: hypothetical protein RBR37_13195, partial [Advenella sp.]|nr:hypothetical protein [Advenella sp.]
MRSIAIGVEASANGATYNESIAIGKSATADGDQAIAIGGQAHAKGNASIAMGADDLDRVASTDAPAWDAEGDNQKYNDTDVAKAYYTLTGDHLVNFESNENGLPGVGKRYAATSAGEAALALGAQSTAGDLATALGTVSTATGLASVALGVHSMATGEGALAIGSVATATGQGATAIGINSVADAQDSVAIGSSSSKGNAARVGSGARAGVALGSNANVTVAGGVALGANSAAGTPMGIQGFVPAYAGDAQKIAIEETVSTAGAVSVGGGFVRRQITNVAAGTQDSDAVNVAQLKAVADAAQNANKGWNVTTNEADKTALVASGAAVDFDNTDGNIVIAQDGTNLTFDLNNDLLLGEVGQPGKDGVDGKIGVTGKDGASVVLNGKDGTIGLTGPAGANGEPGASADLGVQYGKPGLAGNDGANGESKTRIVYKKPDGTTEEVATLNDGLKFKGDDGKEVERKLNETLGLA